MPVYYVPGVVNEFLDDYSLWFKASFGQPNTKYAQMRRQLPVIKEWFLLPTTTEEYRFLMKKETLFMIVHSTTIMKKERN
ncbi:hypothetical protein CCAN12_750024 [Capnocytophaga canimorsus]|uniref:Uncharacterized protein n=1 Tax=Capnocytophaga canimorsus TaxID=28188 RepID=A0A0B7HME4_9FLAO|nr:hypothetical protein CCAN12_750024 [Capnocytophaga canimorsus]